MLLSLFDFPETCKDAYAVFLQIKALQVPKYCFGDQKVARKCPTAPLNRPNVSFHLFLDVGRGGDKGFFAAYVLEISLQEFRNLMGNQKLWLTSEHLPRRKNEIILLGHPDGEAYTLTPEITKSSSFREGV